ncbi:MAG: GAF domain-containing protein, partial [Armatimonadota bacterium]|nr:GAF domain-containing protein [Armatimonadota bacterium]
MQIPLPLNEKERLETLRYYNILDTPPEAAFERITRLTAGLLRAPIALIALIDENRQWFKSHYGLDICEIERDSAFCSHAILSDEVMVVPDARHDGRFADNALVTGPPYIRFYAGAPLKTLTGFNLGTLCVLDTAPRELTEDERTTLVDLAALVVDELELRLATAKNLAEIAERERVEEALRLSETRYRTLFEQFPLSIQVLATDGHTLQVNRAWEQLWGVTLKALGDYNILQDAQLVERGIMPFIKQGFAGTPTAIPPILYDPEETIPNITINENPQRWVQAI